LASPLLLAEWGLMGVAFLLILLLSRLLSEWILLMGRSPARAAPELVFSFLNRSFLRLS